MPRVDFDPQLLREFVAWAGGQPLDGKYNPWGTENCPLALFAHSKYPGGKNIQGGTSDIYVGDMVYRVFPVQVDVVMCTGPFWDAIEVHPWTFGALASRLRTELEHWEQAQQQLHDMAPATIC